MTDHLQEMKQLPQWINWMITKTGQKIPINPFTWLNNTAQNASVTEPGTWGMYEQAKHFNPRHLGFVFTESDEFCGIDLDNCIDPETHQINEVALSMIQHINSYTEWSNSHLGVHIITKTKLPPLVAHKFIIANQFTHEKNFTAEIYDQKRFFIMTEDPILNV